MYADGGHTRVIEDVMAAHPQCEHHVIWTHPAPLPGRVELEQIVRADRPPLVHHAAGDTPLERLRHGRRILAELEPDVIVHAGHPNDPVTLGLFDAPARRRIMVHIADCSFALGRFADAVHVSLGRHFRDAAHALLGLTSTYAYRMGVAMPATVSVPLVPGWASGAARTAPAIDPRSRTK